MNFLRAVVWVWAGLAVGGCAAMRGSDKGPGGVTGRVVDAAHVGVRGVVVTVVTPGEPKELGSATTDGNGQFTVEKVPAGTGLAVVAVRPTSRVGVRARKEGVTVRGGRVTDLGEIPLGVSR
jgi:hypothetical protein